MHRQQHRACFYFHSRDFAVCELQDEDEINHAYEQLLQDGKILMPLAPSTFSEKFGWVEDKFGVSWQLNLEKS